MLIYQHTEVYYLKIPPDGPSSAKQSWTCPQELRSPLSLRNPLFTAAQLRGVGLDRETAGALLSIFVPVCRWLCASQEMSLMFMSWHLLIPANPGLSAYPLPPQFLPSAVSPVPRHLAWGFAGSTAEWNSAPSLPPSLFSYGLFFRHIGVSAQLPAKHHWSLSACLWTWNLVLLVTGLVQWSLDLRKSRNKIIWMSAGSSCRHCIIKK